MANLLNNDEKELLSLVRYFNEQDRKGKVSRLVRKIAVNIDFESAASMTGFTLEEVDERVTAATPKPKKAKTVPTVAEVAIERSKESESVTNLFTEESKSDVRQLIELNENSLTHERLAFDIAKAIDAELKPGETYWPAKEIAARFQCGSVTVTKANRVLIEKRWIVLVDEKNPRHGYVAV